MYARVYKKSKSWIVNKDFASLITMYLLDLSVTTLLPCSNHASFHLGDVFIQE